MPRRFTDEQLNALVNPERRAKLEAVLANRLEGVVILEDIYDPHNAEAVFRSCDAYGIQRVCLVFDEQERFNPRKIGSKTSASANKWLSFSEYNDIEACYADLHAEGYEIIATALTDKTESLFEADLTRPRIAIVMGNEHAGLSEKAVAGADRVMMIPMRGLVQSLNLSVTTATFLYELTRQRMQAGVEDYRLPADQQIEILEDMVIRDSRLNRSKDS